MYHKCAVDCDVVPRLSPPPPPRNYCMTFELAFTLALYSSILSCTCKYEFKVHAIIAHKGGNLGTMRIISRMCASSHTHTNIHTNTFTCTCTCVVTALGVLRCFALFVCLTLLASFFLPSHLSFKNMYLTYTFISHAHTHTHTHTRTHTHTHTHIHTHTHRLHAATAMHWCLAHPAR